VTIKQQIGWPKQWKLTPYTIFGALFLVLGIAALIKPNFSYRISQSEQITANQRVVTETRKVVSIPRPASLAEVVLGAGLVFFGSRRLR
jgi:hypothetical protein